MVISEVMSEEDFRTELGRKIRSWREERKMSREVLAEASGVGHRAIVAYELGQNTVGSYNLYRLASALTVDPSALLP